METIKISVSTTIKATLEKVWEYLNTPQHIVKWNAASPDWHTTHAENNLIIGGKLSSRMEAKDGSIGFDFVGIYDEITPFKTIQYHIEDGRKVQLDFNFENGFTTIVETFEAENTHPIEMQRGGWQAILDNFKNYVENIIE